MLEFDKMVGDFPAVLNFHRLFLQTPPVHLWLTAGFSLTIEAHKTRHNILCCQVNTIGLMYRRGIVAPHTSAPTLHS